MTLKIKLNAVLLGQSGNGKTTLAAAITQIQWQNGSTDKAFRYEELNTEDSIIEETSIPGAVVTFETPCFISPWEWNLFDCKEQQGLVELLNSGMFEFHAGILVVSLVDGVQAQDREQLELARQANIPGILVFYNKYDMIDDRELMDEVLKEVSSLLDSVGYLREDDILVVSSALGTIPEEDTGYGLPSSVSVLLNQLDKCVAESY
jgi:translation elongation factor EF-Tu-like GTPase